MTKPSNAEVGRELLASEIHCGMIVWVQKQNRGVVATVWVMDVGPDSVTFYAGVTDMVFLAKRLPDGHITDDSGLEMAMYLYLGKP